MFFIVLDMYFPWMIELGRASRYLGTYGVPNWGGYDWGGKGGWFGRGYEEEMWTKSPTRIMTDFLFEL